MNEEGRRGGKEGEEGLEEKNRRMRRGWGRVD
jgi:hypothetical protein